MSFASHARALGRHAKARRSIPVRAVLAAAAFAAGPGSAWVAPARAQPVPEARIRPAVAPAAVGVVPGLTPDSREWPGVTVHDSPEALKKIEIAQTMERQKDWNKAAGWYQEVLEQFRDRVVPSHVAADTKYIDQYTSIIFPVQEALAKWPADGLAAYRSRYEATAGSLLEQARADDRDALNKVFQTYFVTEAGKTAGMRLIDLYLEAGEFDGAAWRGERLLRWHPNLLVERPRVAYRTALAYHMFGDARRSREWLDVLKKEAPDALGTVFGKDVVLAELLGEQLTTPPPTAVALSSDAINAIGSGLERSQIPEGGGKAGARQAGVELARVVPRGQNKEAMQSQIERDAREGNTLGVMPMVDRGQMFFQDGTYLYGVSVESGLPLPGWAQTYGGEARGRYVAKGVRVWRNQQQHAVCANENSVLAVMGQPARAAGFDGTTGQGTQLVCLDRATGKQRWAVAARGLRGEKDELSALDFSGSPVVVGDNVYVMARGGKNNQFEDCYVLCFDLNNGLDPRTQKPRWGCFVSSAATGMSMYDDGSGYAPGGTTSHMAYSSGRLFVLSNLGALAAVDAYNGTVVWLSIYPRNSSIGDANGMGRFGGGGMGLPAGKPWTFNPVFERDGKLFILPADAKYLFVYDAGSGLEVKRLAMGDFEKADVQDSLDAPNTLLGVDGKNVYLAGDQRVWCVRWADYAAKKDWLDVQNLCVEWNAASGAKIRGRGFVTSDAVFVPTEEKLTRFRKADGTAGGGRAIDSYPAARNWDRPKEGPGNVVVTGDHVILAGNNSVDVYTDMEKARRKLDAELAAAPGSPEPRLRYAEMMFASGQYGDTMAKLNEAIALLGGLGSMRSGPARDRVFNDALTFAQKQATEKTPSANEQAEKFFDVAATAAAGASQQVNYRLSRARFNRSVGDYTAAVRLYQDVLRDPDLGNVPLGSDDGNAGVVQAAVEAERAIAEVIKTKPAAYGPIEAEAVKALEAAKTAGQAAGLEAVARTYPNSPKVSSAAMNAAAEAYESAGKLRLSTQVLRKVYLKYPEAVDKARVIEAMARNNLALALSSPASAPGRIAVALGRLERADDDNALKGQKLAKPLRLPDGTVLEAATFHEAYAALSKFKPDDAAPPLPDFHLPYKVADVTLKEIEEGKRRDAQGPAFRQESPETTVNDVTALVLPPAELRDWSRFDRVVAWTNAGLAVYAAGQTRPLSVGRPTAAMPTGLAWISAPLGTPGNTPAGPGEGAKPGEEVGAKPDAKSEIKPEAKADGKPGEGDGPGAAAGLLLWNAREVALAEGDDAGKARWRVELKGLPAIDLVSGSGAEPPPAEDVAAGDPNVRTTGRMNRAGFRGGVQRVAMNPNGAADAEENTAPGEEQVSGVYPAGDAVVVATTTGRLFCLDAADGRTRWQTRVGKRAVDRLLATGDFTALKVTDETSVQLVVLDTFDGRILFRKLWNTAENNGIAPVNLDLSPQGLLVWTMPDRLCGKDLYEPGDKALKFEVIGRETADAGNAANPAARNRVAQPAPIYFGCDKPDQLVIAGDRILTLESSGRNFTIHGAKDGKVLRHRDDGNKEVDTVLSTLSRSDSGMQADQNVLLRVAGPYAYAIGTRSLMAYNLESPGVARWKADLQPETQPKYVDAFVGKDYLVMLNQPVRVRAKPTDGLHYQLMGFSRKLVPDERFHRKIESGILVYVQPVTNPAGVLQWQPAEGGIYYLGGDHSLHFLRGARE